MRDFLSRKDAIATPRRFIGTNQSMITSARKLSFAPDIIAGVEEDEYGEATKNLTGRVWKIYKVSDFKILEISHFRKRSLLVSLIKNQRIIFPFYRLALFLDLTTMSKV